jgi:hypothetical protein
LWDLCYLIFGFLPTFWNTWVRPWLFCEISVTWLLVCYIVFCRLLLLLLFNLLSVLYRFTDSDYPIVIFKLFLDRLHCIFFSLVILIDNSFVAGYKWYSFPSEFFLSLQIYVCTWLIDWLVFNVNLSSISAISWRMYVLNVHAVLM